jgi:hypothetical protein
MRSILSFVWFVLAGVLAGANVSAVDYLDWRPFPIGGLNVSLTTSGYRFPQFPDVVPDSAADRKTLPPFPRTRTSFTACVSLTNRSREAIPFTFNDAGPRWIFRIVDSEDREVWRSGSDIASPQVLTDDKLGAGKTWKQTARIPLVIDGNALAAGIYTLQAYLNADKAVSATSVFEVVAPLLKSGIKGLVLKQIAPPDGTLGPIKEVPAAGVQVRVNEILDSLALVKRLPFTWVGYTDSEGRFTVNTPPGRFRVSVYESAYGPGPYPLNVRIGLPQTPVTTAEVTVQQGAFSEVTLRYKSNQPPPITQGISGSVWFANYDPIVVVDQPVLIAQESSQAATEILRLVKVPAPFTPVSIVQLDVPEGATPFSWKGQTDGLGRFQVATPPGRFSVRAGGVVFFANLENDSQSIDQSLTVDSANSILPPNASATVTVAPNAVATVELIMYPGCVIPYAK